MNKESNHFRMKWLLILVLFLVWTVAITLCFISADEVLAAFIRLCYFLDHFLLLLAILLTGYIFGWVPLRWLRLNENSGINRNVLWLEEFLYGIGLGWGIISYLVLFIGVLGWLTSTIVKIFIVVPLIFALPVFLKNIAEREKRGRPGKENTGIGLTPLSCCLLLFIALFALVNLIAVFTPPLNYDTLSYHLGIPELYLTEQRIFSVPDNVYANFPLNVEMLYTLALLLKGDSLAKLLHYSFALLTVLAIYTFSCKHFGCNSVPVGYSKIHTDGSHIGLLAGALFYTTPLVCLLSGWAYNDLGLTFYGFLAVTAFFNWLIKSSEQTEERSKADKWLVLAAVFVGLAIGVKYTSFVLLFCVLILWLLVRVFLPDKQRLSLKFKLRRVLLFILVVLAVASPWFIKNSVYTHNPVYPFFHTFFYRLTGGVGMWYFNSENFIAHHQPASLAPSYLLRLPWRLSMDRDIGIVYLVFVPLLIFVKNVNRLIRFSMIFSGGYFLCWAFFTHQVDRFFIPCLPFLSLAAAYMIMRLKKRAFLYLAITIMISIFIFNMFYVLLVFGRYNLLPVALGLEDRTEFLSKNLYFYDAFAFINKELPPTARILFVGENQGYYCDRRYVANSPLDHSMLVELVNSAQEPDEIFTGLKNLGITHILYNGSEVKRTAKTYGAFNWKDGEAEERFYLFLYGGEYLERMYEKSGVIVFAIREDVR